MNNYYLKLAGRLNRAVMMLEMLARQTGMSDDAILCTQLANVGGMPCPHHQPHEWEMLRNTIAVHCTFEIRVELLPHLGVVLVFDRYPKHKHFNEFVEVHRVNELAVSQYDELLSRIAVTK